MTTKTTTETPRTIAPATAIEGSSVTFPPGLVLEHRHGGRYEAMLERQNAQGLKITRTYTQEERPVRTALGTQTRTMRSISERSETFLAEITRTDRWASKGDTAWIWRVEYLASDWDSPKAGEISINGYCRHGRQALRYRSDAEAQAQLRSLRYDHGRRIQTADMHPLSAQAAENYSTLMSR